jgi:hypothetical protein
MTEQYARSLGGVRIEVYRGFGPHGEMAAKEPQLVLTSDEHGQVVLPKLPHGRYHVLALATPNLRDDLYLNISFRAARKPREFTMNLVPYDPPPTYEQRITAAEFSSDVKRLTEFRGVVCDQAGAPIPNASVDVLFKGTDGKRYAARLRTDGSGKFASNLPEGNYVAFVRCQGFSDRVIAVVIAKTGSDNELKVELEIGRSS